MPEIDLAKVLCALEEIPDGATRGFSVGEGDWPLRGLIVRIGGAVHAYVNRCPHAGHPLNFRAHDFLTPDGRLIVCRSHGAVFEKSTGFCVAGPCAGETLSRLPVEIREGFVCLAGAD